MDGQLSKRHESCQHKLISRYYEGYVTICNKLKDIDLNPLGPWNAPTHLRTLDELEDCLGDLAIALQAIKEGCSEHLTDADVVCITSNLSDLDTKRQVTYNWVQEAVAFWSNSVFSDSSTIYVGPAEMTGEVSAVAELSSVETGTMGPPTTQPTEAMAQVVGKHEQLKMAKASLDSHDQPQGADGPPTPAMIYHPAAPPIPVPETEVSNLDSAAICGELSEHTADEAAAGDNIENVSNVETSGFGLTELCMDPCSREREVSMMQGKLCLAPVMRLWSLTSLTYVSSNSVSSSSASEQTLSTISLLSSGTVSHSGFTTTASVSVLTEMASLEV